MKAKEDRGQVIERLHICPSSDVYYTIYCDAGLPKNDIVDLLLSSLASNGEARAIGLLITICCLAYNAYEMS